MTVIRNRSAVRAGLTFGEQQKPQSEARAGGQKFSQALESVSEREEKRRQRQQKGKGEDEAEEKAPAKVKDTRAETRQKELLKKLPPQQKPAAPVLPPMVAPPPTRRGAPVPRVLAEAVTDPRMARPQAQGGFEQLPETDALQRAAPAPSSAEIMDDIGAGTSMHGGVLEVNLGDGSSLPMLAEEEFFEVALETNPGVPEEGPATFADLPETALEGAAEEDIFAGTAFARRKR